VLVCVVLLGVIVRASPFIFAPAMYLDEAMLALNVATRDWSGLTQPLAFEQSAPLLYLWLSRLVVVMGGVTEHTVRLLPTLSGILLAPAVWSVSRRVLSVPAALLATAIAALCPLAVWYANVAKPYAVDALVATLLLLAAHKVRRSQSDRAWLTLALLALLAPFASAPSVFILAGVVVALLPKRGDRQGRPLLRYLGLLTGVAVGAGANYLLFQRTVGGGDYLLRFYDRAFPWPPDASLPARLSELISGFTQFFFFARSTDVPAAILVATILITGIGVVVLHRRHGWRWTALCLTPFIAVTAAAVLRKYPPVERLLLFLTPLLAVLTAAGLEYLVSLLARRRQVLGVAIAGCGFLFLALYTDIRNVLQPHGEGAEVRPMLTQYEDGRSPGDPVYLYARAVPIWAFYTTDWSLPDRPRLDSLLALARRLGPNSGNAPSRGRPVLHEGFELVVRSGDHDELVGTPSGIEILYRGSGRRTPDPGWADNEVARMRATGRQQIWVVLTHHSTEVETDLQAAIFRAGGSIAEDWREWAARLWHVRFPAS
jgi:hypothetical protein